jgi:hypothetical protein
VSYETLEGWYTDPYALHEARGLSNGEPTKLARDGEVTSDDEPPEGEFTRVPEPIEPDPNAGPSDLVRADKAESNGSSMDHGETSMRQMDAVWSDGALMRWIHDLKGSADEMSLLPSCSWGNEGRGQVGASTQGGRLDTAN